MDNKVLGKGLSALIPQKIKEQIIENQSFEKSMSSLEIKGQMSSLEIEKIKFNSLQPRKDYDLERMSDLTTSIKEKGVLQPILVRPSGNGYEVIAGERRLRAAKSLSLKYIPAIIKNVTDREALVLALVENIQRQELNPIEEAQGFKRLIEEFNFTQETVAESIGKDRATISNLMRLLRLPEELQGFVASGKLSVGHARALLSLEDKNDQHKMANEIITQGLSVRQVEANVKKMRNDKSNKITQGTKNKDRDLQILEEELARILGTKVTVENKNNKGKLTIEYYSLNDLDRILGVIRR